MAASATASSQPQQQQQQQLPGILIDVALQGFTVLGMDGKFRRASQYYKYPSQDISGCNELFVHALTLDEMEYLASRVLHLFLRALASEIPFVLMSDVVTALEHYHSKNKYLEQMLDLYIIKADVSMTKAAALEPYRQDVDFSRRIHGIHRQGQSRPPPGRLCI
jgi:hypothetical protein